MPNKVSVIPIIDTSASMLYSGYVETTVIDSKAFISKLLPKDLFAIARFDITGKIVYPVSGLKEVDQNLTALKEARGVIAQLTFNGPNTNITAGIEAAHSLLAQAPEKRAAVLLSDGLHNLGPSPLTLLPTGYPIFTCAMGPESDQDLLKKIADKTGGSYYYMPTPVHLMQILNNIRGKAPNTFVSRNDRYQINAKDFELVPVQIQANNHQVQFSVVWSSSKYQYASQPGLYKLRITLVDPDGNVLDDKPFVAEPGFAIFSLKKPKAGEWQVQIEYGGPANPLNVTVGGFEYTVMGVPAPDLKVKVPEVIRPGEELPVQVSAFEGEQAVTDVALRVAVIRPEWSVESALEKFADQLGRIRELPPDLSNLPEEHARLFALHRMSLPAEDILPTVRSPVPAVQQAPGKFLADFRETHYAGSYNVEIHASGVSPTRGRFERTRIVSVLVR